VCVTYQVVRGGGGKVVRGGGGKVVRGGGKVSISLTVTTYNSGTTLKAWQAMLAIC
jgi:hypothetical protein